MKVLSNGMLADIKDRLERRFGPGQLSENHLMELRCKRQGPRETLRKLGQAIRELATLAYPDIAATHYPNKDNQCGARPWFYAENRTLGYIIKFHGTKRIRSKVTILAYITK